jgi:hypothetical protein
VVFFQPLSDARVSASGFARCQDSKAGIKTKRLSGAYDLMTKTLDTRLANGLEADPSAYERFSQKGA